MRGGYIQEVLTAYYSSTSGRNIVVAWEVWFVYVVDARSSRVYVDDCRHRIL